MLCAVILHVIPAVAVVNPACLLFVVGIVIPVVVNLPPLFCRYHG